MTSATEDLLLDRLQSKLFHCTGLTQFQEIQRDGFIRPNTDNRAFSFPKTINSYGYSIKAVCLFDLKDQPVEVCRDGLFFRWSFRLFDSPVTIIMILDRLLLDGKLISNSAARGVSPYKDYIPYIEAWCKECIPISAITACIVLCTVGDVEFAFLEGNCQLLERVDQKVNDFRSKYAEAYKKEAEELRTFKNSITRRRIT